MIFRDCLLIHLILHEFPSFPTSWALTSTSWDLWAERQACHPSGLHGRRATMQRAPQGGSLWKASCWISNSMYVSFKSDFGYFGYVGYVMIFHDISWYFYQNQSFNWLDIDSFRFSGLCLLSLIYGHHRIKLWISMKMTGYNAYIVVLVTRQAGVSSLKPPRYGGKLHLGWALQMKCHCSKKQTMSKGVWGSICRWLPQNWVASRKGHLRHPVAKLPPSIPCAPIQHRPLQPVGLGSFHDREQQNSCWSLENCGPVHPWNEPNRSSVAPCRSVGGPHPKPICYNLAVSETKVVNHNFPP